MAPFTRSWARMNSSLSWLSTSTSALPMPTTSSSATGGAPLLRGGVLVEEERQPLPRPRGKGSGAGDDGGAERARAPRRASLADARQYAAQHHARGRDVFHEVRDHRLHGHGVVLLVPDVVVGGEGEG